MIRIAINGIDGRMGQAVKNAIELNPQTEFYKGLNRNTRFEIKRNKADVIIDFSSEYGLISLLEEIEKAESSCKIPMIVSGTTGISEETFARMKKFGKSNSNCLVWGSNTSFGVNLMFSMVKKLGVLLGEEYDAEIYERHHRMKKDAPSGTALTIGQKIAEGRGSNFIQRDYSIQGERKIGEIGFSSERGGKTVGYHEASFISDDERIWLGHEAFDRSIFAKGAVKLAVLAHTQKLVGYHEACDVLLNTL